MRSTPHPLENVDTSSAPDRYSRATILIRALVGWVFISEGILKFLRPMELGVGRFVAIGIPAPEFMALFVAVVEIVCGTLILVGLYSRLATLPLLIDMFVAIGTTKIPILLQSGFWKMAHESRVDISMLFGLVFLLLAGSGGWSVDRWRAGRKKSLLP